MTYHVTCGFCGEQSEFTGDEEAWTCPGCGEVIVA